MKKPREIHKATALSIAMLIGLAVSVSIIFLQDSAAAETNICWTLDTKPHEVDNQVAEQIMSIYALKFAQAPQRRAREGQPIWDRREAERVQKTAEEALGKFPTPDQIAAIQNSEQREYIQRIHGYLVRAQQEATRWNINEAENFANEVNAVIAQPLPGEPFNEEDNATYRKRKTEDPSCDFCQNKIEAQSCVFKCLADEACCLTQNGCWEWDEKERVCKSGYFSCAGCQLLTTYCYADCLIPGRIIPGQTTPHDPTIKHQPTKPQPTIPQDPTIKRR
jgi:hypothetical protein